MHPTLSPSLLVAALLTWSEQVCVVAAAGALASFAIANPKVRLAMWQGLLLVLLMLPVIEPWRTSAAVGATPAGPIAAAFTGKPVERTVWSAEYWLWIIAAGALMRLFSLGLGLWRLRSYRQRARPLAEPRLRVASAAARWYVSDAIASPVTYGWRRPVILLPAKVLELPSDLREAIECHELIHFHRGDWAWVLAETAVRSVLWFHPAVWFVMSRIQLAREQAVDREVVRVLQNRDRYLDALVAVASDQLASGIAPAFLKKRQLAIRVDALIKEVHMSRTRIAAGVVAVGSIVPLAVTGAMWLFPFVGNAQTTQAGATVYLPGDGVTNPIPISRPQPEYTEQARRARWGGTVVLSVVIDEKGVPKSIKVVKPLGFGLDEKAIEAAEQWRFQPAMKNGMPVPVRAQIEFTFNPRSDH
jgi:bla regulator protein blaR1